MEPQCTTQPSCGPRAGRLIRWSSTLLGRRLTVRLRPLEPRIGVRIPASQPTTLSSVLPSGEEVLSGNAGSPNPGSLCRLTSVTINTIYDLVSVNRLHPPERQYLRSIRPDVIY